jgi:phenylalanyl-tRNA synthetase alpha chain
MSDEPLERIRAIEERARAEIAEAGSTGRLEELRVAHLGRRAELPNLLRGVGALPPDQRGAVGQAANRLRRALEALIEERSQALAAAELDERLARDRVDVTLPGDPPEPVGRLHLLTATRRELEDVFAGLGFRVLEGPEVELVHYNFDALNHDAAHPARQRSDTFYVSDDVLLRTHTSPMQVRAMEAQAPPLYIVVPGRVYRRDSDATHTPQFHQLEGLAVDADITLADLQGTLLAFARAVFGEDRRVRLRPHFFPFTEPSVEVDVSCFRCVDGFVEGGAKCPLCKGSTWIEILGAGQVDPNVFAMLGRPEYDPERIQGFAFGMGVERIAMLKHRVPDLRLLYDNDVRLLEQFG